MKKISEKIRNVKNRALNYIACKQCGVKMEAGDHLVEILGTIIIAVVILSFFREQITAMFENLMNQTNSKVTELFQHVN